MRVKHVYNDKNSWLRIVYAADIKCCNLISHEHYHLHFLTKFKLNILNIIIFSELVPVWKKRLIHSFIFEKFYNLFKNATMWLAKSIFGHILRTKISPKMQFLQNVNRPLLQFLIKIRANIFPLLRLIFNYNSPVNSWNTIRAGRGWWW